MRAFFFALVFVTTMHAAERITVPRAAAPKIDGSIGADEWKNAVRVELTNGGQASLQHDSTFLYVALTGPRDGIGSICVTSGGDVRILHASASIGTADFTLLRGGKWRNSRPFFFSIRDTGPGVLLMKIRSRFIEEEGWFANVVRQGSREREYQIRLDSRRELPIALMFLGFGGGGVETRHYWPPALADACASQKLAAGFTDGQYSFDSKSWGVAAMGE